jgi:hypothetical protein
MYPFANLCASSTSTATVCPGLDRMEEFMCNVVSTHNLIGPLGVASTVSQPHYEDFLALSAN